MWRLPAVGLRVAAGVWLLEMLLLWVTEAPLSLAFALGLLGGAGCYFSGVHVRGRFLLVLARIAGYSLMAVLAWLFVSQAYRALTWDPTGSARDLSAACYEIRNVGARSNRKRMIAAIRFAACSNGPLAGEVDFYYFVFVRRNSSRNGPQNLIFRYFATSSPNSAPGIEWFGDSTLKITVGEGAIQQVTKQRHRVGHIKILYALGNQREPAALHWWQRMWDA